MPASPLAEFYQEVTICTGAELSALLPSGIQQEVGHFNVFSLADLWQVGQEEPSAPYPCRSFYKISLLNGRSRLEYHGVSLDLGAGAGFLLA